MAGAEIEALIRHLAKLPGLGPRSARRIALALLKKRESMLDPLVRTMTVAAETVKICAACGNFDSQDPCAICTDNRRDPAIVCVVESVSDLWAMERTTCSSAGAAGVVSVSADAGRWSNSSASSARAMMVQPSAMLNAIGLRMLLATGE